LTRAIAILVVLMCAATASADTPPDAPAPPVVRPTWSWSVGLLVRSTRSDPTAGDKLGRLDEYGWVTHRPAMTGLRGDLAYLQAPIVDVGFAWAWARGTYATGPLYDDPDTITGESLEAGALARVHWVKPSSPVAAEPRVELGVARSTTSMRGVDASRLGWYTRVGLDFRISGHRGGAVFAVDYTSVHQRRDAMIDVPTGGITFSLSFSWRQW
jgi:hypothetical protein